MKIEVQIDEKCKESKVIILTNKKTTEIDDIINKLSDSQSKIIVGFKNNMVEILNTSNIYRIYSEGNKVIAETINGEYTLKLRLYEVEQKLDSNLFVRISNSEIINLKKVKHFDLSLSGTIRITLLNNTVTYVSRRTVAKIKQLLGL
jgi:DNA-binding LytR/AlgR family response regulator